MMDTRQRLRKLIERSDTLTFVNVSVRAGLSDSAVHKYCTGRTQSMTTDNLQKVAIAAGVSLRWLLFGEENPQVVTLFERIPANRRQQAMDYLESIADMPSCAAVNARSNDAAIAASVEPCLIIDDARERTATVAVC